ncbi:MAG TPA: AAA family ATPase [Candidatus Bariatricus faecipullorum]|nr:AAA family ATPase [Candidatus Bariatricus faecipullorum]
MRESQKKAADVIRQVNQVILGKAEVVEEVFLAFLAGGHVLLEDIPGVGKTTLAMAFSRSLGLECRRVQFTPDVLPSDLTGFSIYRKEEEKFVFQPGSVFCNLLLADEINRTSPKTQSALLEVMEEHRVSTEGVTREVPEPFLVIATQNPSGTAGTQFLPEAQTDRLHPVIGKEEFLALQEEVQQVYLKEDVGRYLTGLIRATREHPALERGASPRATTVLVKMAKAEAWMRGRDYVTPADVKKQFAPVTVHRIRRTAEARMEGREKQAILTEICQAAVPPSLGRRSG